MITPGKSGLYRWVPCKSIAWEFMLFKFTRMPNRRFRSLLLCPLLMAWKFVCFVFTRMSSDGYPRQFRSLSLSPLLIALDFMCFV